MSSLKKIKSSYFIMLVMFLLLSFSTITVNAAADVSSDGISVTGITSDGKKATVDVVTVASGKATKVLEANKTYVIAEKDALAFAELLKKWNATMNHWEKGTWKGMLMFDKVISEAIEKYKADATLPFEVDYATLMYLYQTMSNPAGTGLESARAMAELEGFDPITADKKDEEN